MDVGSETPVPENSQTGSWVVETSAGKSLRLADLATLHKWIIERRVGRDDRLCRDNQTWLRLGDDAELVPFFEIVDSAERARVPQVTPPPAPLPAPLAVPVLQPPPSAHSSGALPRQLASGASSPGSVAAGAIPGASTERDETVIIRVPAKKSLSLAKLLLTGAIAAGVAYAGIVWQHHRLIPAAVEAGIDKAAQHEPAPSVPVAAPAAAHDESTETATARGPQVRPIAASADETAPAPDSENPGSGAKAVAAHRGKTPVAGRAENIAADTPQALATQGYVALDHKQYSLAVRHFRQSLASNPSNGTALFGLAEAYRNLGQRPAALQTYRRYLEELPSGPDAGRARAQLRVLEGKRR